MTTSREAALEAALDALVHACMDDIDDYNAISDACDAALALLPNHVPNDKRT